MESENRVSMHIILGLMILILSLSNMAFGEDPGQPDHIIVGNQDSTAILAMPGQIISIPVWTKTDEDVIGIQFCIATEDEFISNRMDGQIYYPLTSWDAGYGFCCIVPGEPSPLYTSQGFFAVAETGPPYASTPLNTGGSFMNIYDFTFQISSDTAIVGDSTTIILGSIPYWGGTQNLYVSNSDEFSPQFFGGKIKIVPPADCGYATGDVNGSDNFNGLDVTYGVAYFKGGDPPHYQCECTPGNTWYVCGDVNGDCAYNGLDIGYGVNYLKGGPAIASCFNCPPTE